MATPCWKKCIATIRCPIHWSLWVKINILKVYRLIIGRNICTIPTLWNIVCIRVCWLFLKLHGLRWIKRITKTLNAVSTMLMCVWMVMMSITIFRNLNNRTDLVTLWLLLIPLLWHSKRHVPKRWFTRWTVLTRHLCLLNTQNRLKWQKPLP